LAWSLGQKVFFRLEVLVLANSSMTKRVILLGHAWSDWWFYWLFCIFGLVIVKKQCLLMQLLH